jgi:hypothetical protein
VSTTGLLGSLAPIRRNVFISSFHADREEVDDFLERWGTIEKVFTPKALYTYDNEDFINSSNTDYVMSEIRRRYIGDASVTIVLIGTCTHSRRYVDWEIKASLTQGTSTPNGLLAFVLPSAMPSVYDLWGNPIDWQSRSWPEIPERLKANWNFNNQQSCYGRYFVAPSSASELRQHIENAYYDRTNRADLIVNSQDMFGYNAKCKRCGLTH